MKTITLCEGILGYFTFELYTIGEEPTKAYHLHLPRGRSGISIGRGYDFGAQGNKPKAEYIFEHLLKMGKNTPEDIMSWSVLLDDQLHVAQGDIAETLLNKYKKEKKDILISTEQVFALFHVSWSKSKKDTIYEGYESGGFKKGNFHAVAESIYPPLREVLISASHSSRNKDFEKEINGTPEFLPQSTATPLEQCRKMSKILRLWAEKEGSRFLSRFIYANLLEKTLEEGTEIIWVPLRDNYLIDFTAEELGESTDKEMASKEVAKQFLLGLKDFPWKNYNKGYEISLSNFNIMLNDKQNKTMEFASIVKVYTEIGSLNNSHYGFLEHNNKKSSYNVLRLITNLAVKRALNKVRSGNDKFNLMANELSEINLDPKIKNEKNELVDVGHAQWDSSTEKLWQMYQKWQGISISSYPDVVTMLLLFGGKGITQANTFGTDRVTEVLKGLDNSAASNSYKLSENWDVVLDVDDITYLRQLINTPSKKGVIKGSVGYRSDNYFRDVMVVRILLERLKKKEKALEQNLLLAAQWRISPQMKKIESNYSLVVCDTLMEEQIKDFQRTVLGTTKPNGYITPDSTELKKLNGE